MNHAGTFAHPAQADSDIAGVIRGRQVKGYSKFLVDRVGGHDRPAGRGAGIQGIGQGGSHLQDAGGNPVQRNIGPDHAGGSQQKTVKSQHHDG